MCVANLITSRDCHVISLNRKKWMMGNGGSLIHTVFLKYKDQHPSLKLTIILNIDYSNWKMYFVNLGFIFLPVYYFESSDSAHSDM